MVSRIVGVVVDAKHDRRVHALPRRGDDHPLGATCQVYRSRLPGAELAGGLDHHLDAVRGPVEFGRLSDRADRDLATVDYERLAAQFDVPGERPERTVVPQQPRDRQ